MTFYRQVSSPNRRRLAVLVIVAVVALMATTLVALAATPLGVAGYLNHSYAGTVAEPNSVDEPTAKGAESKLWWHDGYWWGVLFGPESDAYTIHRLDPTSHDWVDSGVVVDTRIHVNDSYGAQADVLMDSGEGKVYIATHVEHGNPSFNSNADNQAKLKRYSYNAGTWSLDTGFEDVTINEDITRALVMDRDSTGRLWISYVSRRGDSGYQVYVNASNPADATDWGEPFVLDFPEAVGLVMEDISALAAFNDAEGPKVAVMWSNQTTGNFYLAVRPDSAGADPEAGWSLEAGLTNLFSAGAADDHLKLSPAPGNLLVATVKTNLTGPGDPLVAVVKRAADGAYSLHPVALFSTQDTRPTMAVDAGNNQVKVITVSKEGGGNVCVQSADLPDLVFAGGDSYNCPPPPTDEPELLRFEAIHAIEPEIFIGDDDTYVAINDPTTTKQLLTPEMGFAVLASDEVEQVYVHNHVAGVQEEYGVELSPDQAMTGLVGAVVTYNMTVTNTGATDDSFALTVASGWAATLSASNTGTLAPGDAFNFTVEVTVDAAAADGDTNVTVVTATSDADNSVTDTASLTTTAVIEAIYGVDLSAATTAQSDYVGATVAYTIVISNTGNVPDTFTVTLAGNSWPTDVAPPSVDLQPGASAELTVSVQIPADAAHGAQDAVMVTATSQGDPEVSDSLELMTTAQQYMLFLPLIVNND